MLSITFDETRAATVLATSYAAYQARTHLYQVYHADNGSAPQHRHIPRGVSPGSYEHQIWLYGAVLSDRRGISEENYKGHVELWQTHENLYRQGISDIPVETIARHLGQAGISMPNQIAGLWKRSGTTLYQEWGGDPLAIFGSGSIDNVLAYCKQQKVDPLPGYGPKLLSLLSLFYEELGLLKPIEGAFPVDVHVQRIMQTTRCIRGSGLIDSHELAEFLRPRLFELCRVNGWSPLAMSHALWFNGNKACSHCRTLKDILVRCPIYALCTGTVGSTRIYFDRGKWNPDLPLLPKGCESQPALWSDQP